MMKTKVIKESVKGLNLDSTNLIYHPERVSEWLVKRDCFPIYIEIGPTNRCNHRCSFCALDWVKKDRTDIDKEIMLSCLENMAEHGVKSVMFAGEGEPLLHREIYEFIRHAKKEGLDVSLTTNGVLFSQDRAEKCLPYFSWLRFSVDAGTPKTYAKIHGTRKEDFRRVMGNIEEAVRIKRKLGLKTTIGIQLLLMQENAAEVYNLAERIKELGADNMQVKPYSQHPSSRNKIKINYGDYTALGAKLRELNSDEFEVKFRETAMQRVEEKCDYKECHGLPFFALIDAKGNVIPCNLFYDKLEFAYGNLYDKSFAGIWKSERRKRVLKKLERRGTERCRKGCRLDASNRYLDRIKNPYPYDNFI